MDIIESILELPKQCKQAWDESSQLELPQDWDIQNIVICGMGGSALGAHVLQTSGSVKVPMAINNNYLLPYFANVNTLVVLASYSGNTEEVLSCAEDAKSKNCKIVGITTGGKLRDWLRENNFPGYVFDPKYNSTGQARMGVGYNLFGLAGILHSLQLFNIHYFADIVKFSIAFLIESLEETQNEAKEFAKKLKDKFPVIFASGYLVGNAHIFANQLNETAKTLSSYHAVPEANHHLLEGLKHPKFPSAAIFLGVDYTDMVVKRLEITKEILEKSGWEVLWYKPKKGDQFAQSLQTIFFSSLVAAYLALEYGEDPVSIPTVDYFKEKLGS